MMFDWNDYRKQVGTRIPRLEELALRQSVAIEHSAMLAPRPAYSTRRSVN